MARGQGSWWDSGRKEPSSEGAVIDAATVGLAVSADHLTDQPPNAAKRAYRSEARREQARQTRGRVSATAATLFATHGYARTSIRQIAEAAGVSIETIYAGGDKRTLFLHAFQLALRGDTDGTPLLELAPLERAAAAGDLEQFLSAIIEFVVDANALSSRLWVAFVEGASSDPLLADAYAQQMADMRVQGRKVLDDAVRRRLCPEPHDPSRTVDAIWAALHPSQYDLLVTQAGWTPALYKAWLASSVRHILTAL